MTQPVPPRRSIQERLAALNATPNPLLQTDLNLLADEPSTTATFSVIATGELVADEVVPLPVTVERVGPRGSIDPLTAAAYHLLVLPPEVAPEDVEALAVSVWPEAGWAAPGVIRLQESVSLEGPWELDGETMRALGMAHSASGFLAATSDAPNEAEVVAQAWLLRCPPHRGAAPDAQVQSFDTWARAFPDGMPVGVEQKVLDVLRRISRRLDGAVRVAGSGAVVRAEVDPTVNLRVFTNRWVPPGQMKQILSRHIEGVTLANQPGMTTEIVEGMPYALLAPVSSSSQVLIGVREERFVPRSLRWEWWAKPPLVVHEVIWVEPEDIASDPPTRRSRLERTRAERIAEIAAASIATASEHCAVVDEDGFLVAVAELPEDEHSRAL